MTRVRALDAGGDWLFGKGQSDYLTANNAIAQNIQTRLYSFLGDCCFDTAAGIDWWNQLGAKDQTALNLSIAAVILNTGDVTGILQLSITVSETTRALTVTYKVSTTYSTVSGLFVFDSNQLIGG